MNCLRWMWTSMAILHSIKIHRITFVQDIVSPRIHMTKNSVNLLCYRWFSLKDQLQSFLCICVNSLPGCFVVLHGLGKNVLVWVSEIFWQENAPYLKFETNSWSPMNCFKGMKRTLQTSATTRIGGTLKLQIVSGSWPPSQRMLVVQLRQLKMDPRWTTTTLANWSLLSYSL